MTNYRDTFFLVHISHPYCGQGLPELSIHLQPLELHEADWRGKRWATGDLKTPVKTPFKDELFLVNHSTGLVRCSAGSKSQAFQPMTLGVIKAVFVDMTPTSWVFTSTVELWPGTIFGW